MMSDEKFTVFNNAVGCAAHHCKTLDTSAFCDTCDDIFTPERQTTHRAQSLSYRIVSYRSVLHISSQCAIPYGTKGRVA